MSRHMRTDLPSTALPLPKGLSVRGRGEVFPHLSPAHRKPARTKVTVCYTIVTMLKSHSCGQLRPSHEGETVSLAGWVHRRRDHGVLIFIDLRDHDGLVQTVFNPQEAKDAYAVADTVRGEYVLRVTGTVQRRPAGPEQEALPTGEVEGHASQAEALTPPKPA